MPFYQRRGRLPRKRHTVLRRDDGSLVYEELIGNESFQGGSSLLYHLHRPTRVARTERVRELNWAPAEDRTLRPHHFRLAGLPRQGDPVLNRIPVLFNEDVALSAVRPDRVEEGFFRNGQGDEVIFVAKGEGALESGFGDLEFAAGDYLVVPRGIVHRYRLTGDDHLFLCVESASPVKIPARYRNSNGQFLEGAPFSERDIRLPGELRTHDETGRFSVFTKQRNMVTRHEVLAHPFDLVGWDGTYYPWAFNIRDFEPVVGRIHQPPPVHQTFEGEGFVVCSFVPRLFDFDSEAVPAPYHHTNVGSEEILFYAAGEFMSRKGVEFASVTYHPNGMPHGPQPGKTEASIGAKETNEVAVMVDTFRPLTVARAALAVDDETYPSSWLE